MEARPHAASPNWGRKAKATTVCLIKARRKPSKCRKLPKPNAMEVKVLETTTVFASSCPLDHDLLLPLSHLDNDLNLHVTFRTLRAYANPNPSSPPSSDPVQVISQALSKALYHYYQFAGTLRLRPSDRRLELCCSGRQGVPVISASATCSLAYANYLDDPGSPFLEQLVPNPTGGEELVHPLIVQITVFACGGFSLGLCIHHSMCDGLGSTQFLNAMAELARGASEPSVQPVWDRAILLGPRGPPRVEIALLHEHLILDKKFYAYSQVDCRVLRECFHVRDDCLERFKARLFEESGSSFTTFEALGAFIWRARVKASRVPGQEKVKFVYSTNIRKQVRPALPTGYWGNGCVPMYVQMTAGELTERPIWETAELIKQSKRNISDVYVRSFVDFQELYYAEGITAGKGVSGFTDWRHLGHSSVDFGWGGPVTVLPLSWKLLGTMEPCFFLPYSSAGEGKIDGFKVLVSLPEAAMPAFRNDMEEFSGKKA